MQVNASFCIPQPRPRAFNPMLTDAQTHYTAPLDKSELACPYSHVTAVMRTGFAKAPIQRLPACIVPSVEHPPSYNQSPGQFRIAPSRGRGSAVIYMSRLSGFYDITSCRLQFICSCTPRFSWLAPFVR